MKTTMHQFSGIPQLTETNYVLTLTSKEANKSKGNRVFRHLE